MSSSYCFRASSIWRSVNSLSVDTKLVHKREFDFLPRASKLFCFNKSNRDLEMTKVIARFVSIRNSCGIFRCSSFKEGFECTNECLISYRVLVNHSALVTTAEVLKRVLSEQSAC